jgi:hypothetical protein
MLTPKEQLAKQKALTWAMCPPAVKSFGVERDMRPQARNIIGVGIGVKTTGGAMLTGQVAVRIYVRVKTPRHELDPAWLVPDWFGGLPTDVIETGDIVPYAGLQQEEVPTWQRYDRHRPTPCGVSVGHVGTTAGTLGCLVQKDGQQYILSNNHVLANSNRGEAGDLILQPGPFDGGMAERDRIALLEPYEPIDFEGNANLIDAAIGLVGPQGQGVVWPEIIDIGPVNPVPKEGVLYQSVRKHGRTTGHTVGVIMDVSASFWVGFEQGNGWFEDQIAIQGVGTAPFSQSGDSGSLIVDAVTLQPVGLLFAGGGNMTFANPIGAVLAAYGVTVVGSAEAEPPQEPEENDDD